MAARPGLRMAAPFGLNQWPDYAALQNRDRPLLGVSALNEPKMSK
jgi:hypothetical protein